MGASKTLEDIEDQLSTFSTALQRSKRPESKIQARPSAPSSPSSGDPMRPTPSFGGSRNGASLARTLAPLKKAPKRRAKDDSGIQYYGKGGMRSLGGSREI